MFVRDYSRRRSTADPTKIRDLHRVVFHRGWFQNTY